MTKREFLESYAEYVQRIRLKKQQSEGDLFPSIISKEIAELEQRRRAVLEAIETAPEPEMRAILEARYINRLTVERTALQLGYSIRSIHRLTEKALKKMRFPADIE